MKRMVLIWAALLVACQTVVKAPRTDIVPVSDLKAIGAIAQAAPKPTLLVLDIDDTLLSTPARGNHGRSFFGSDRWYQWQSKLPGGDAHKVPCLFEVLEWNAELDTLSATQQDADIVVNGTAIDKIILTSRNPKVRVGTERELHRAKYGAVPALGNNDARFPMQVLPGKFDPMTYENGILMTGGTPKGPALAALLHALNRDVYYKSVIMVDDGQPNLDSVQQQLAGGPIEFHGLRYTGIKDDPFPGPSPSEVQEAGEAWENWLKFLDQVYPERRAWLAEGCPK